MLKSKQTGCNLEQRFLSYNLPQFPWNVKEITFQLTFLASYSTSKVFKESLRPKFYIHKFRSKSLMFSCYFIPTRPYYVFLLKKGLGSRMFSRDTTGGGRLQFTVSWHVQSETYTSSAFFGIFDSGHFMKTYLSGMKLFCIT